MSHKHLADKSGHSLQQALIGLYLSVKVRSKQDVESYSKGKQEEEEESLKEADPFLIIEYVKSSIDILMNCQMERAVQMAEAKREAENESRQDCPRDLEQLTQSLEAEVRLHIRVMLFPLSEIGRTTAENSDRNS